MTAVEYLVSTIDKKYINAFISKIVEEAKEMENRQSKNYAEFAIHCDREKMKILNFNDFMKL
jgi:arsenate reductase-like glutaredoxin family protein